jgi:hypothetical protein
MKREEIEEVGFSTTLLAETDQPIGVEFDTPIPDAEIPVAAADRENATTSRSTNSLLTERSPLLPIFGPLYDRGLFSVLKY